LKTCENAFLCNAHAVRIGRIGFQYRAQYGQIERDERRRRRSVEHGFSEKIDDCPGYFGISGFLENEKPSKPSERRRDRESRKGVARNETLGSKEVFQSDERKDGKKEYGGQNRPDRHAVVLEHFGGFRVRYGCGVAFDGEERPHEYRGEEKGKKEESSDRKFWRAHGNGW
jgi:hypothetical protein